MMERVSEAAGFALTNDSFDRLQTFCDLVSKWNPKINLVSRASIGDIWLRHVIDSAQLYGYAPKSSQLWVDMGSGGGFPGIVLAILASQADPDRKFIFIESDQRKAVFLREAARVCGCRVEVVCDRLETAKPVGADVVSARALAGLDLLLSFVNRHLTPGGTALLLKGSNYQEELELARGHWRFDYAETPSISDSTGRVLRIENLTERAKDR